MTSPDAEQRPDDRPLFPDRLVHQGQPHGTADDGRREPNQSWWSLLPVLVAVEVMRSRARRTTDPCWDCPSHLDLKVTKDGTVEVFTVHDRSCPAAGGAR
jgi:hypothetical protein